MGEKKKSTSLSRTLRLLSAGGSALAVAALVVSLMSGWIVVKLYRSIDAFQKTLPVVRRAAQLYLDENSAKKEREPLE